MPTAETLKLIPAGDISNEKGLSLTDVVQKLWGFCHTLRHDGIDYGDYIEQITYLLFLKMADERGVDAAEGLRLADAADESGTALIDHYTDPSARSASSPASWATSSPRRSPASTTRSTSSN